MRRLIAACAVAFTITSAQAADLSQAALQGTWLVVEFAGKPDSDNMRWEFKGNQFYQVLDTMRVSPDEYTASGSVIDLGYAQITVKSFDGSEMEAVMAGFSYKLRKQ